MILQDIRTVDTAFDWLIANLGTAMESSIRSPLSPIFLISCICKLMLSNEMTEGQEYRT